MAGLENAGWTFVRNNPNNSAMSDLGNYYLDPAIFPLMDWLETVDWTDPSIMRDGIEAPDGTVIVPPAETTAQPTQSEPVGQPEETVFTDPAASSIPPSTTAGGGYGFDWDTVVTLPDGVTVRTDIPEYDPDYAGTPGFVDNTTVVAGGTGGGGGGGGGSTSSGNTSSTDGWIYPNDNLPTQGAVISDRHTNPDGSVVIVYSDGAERYEEAPTVQPPTPPTTPTTGSNYDFIPDIILTGDNDNTTQQPTTSNTTSTDTTTTGGTGGGVDVGTGSGDGSGEGTGTGSGEGSGDGAGIGLGLLSGMSARQPSITERVFGDLPEFTRLTTTLLSPLYRS
jgi:hypothetical protein